MPFAMTPGWWKSVFMNGRDMLLPTIAMFNVA